VQADADLTTELREHVLDVAAGTFDKFIADLQTIAARFEDRPKSGA